MPMVLKGNDMMTGETATTFLETVRAFRPRILAERDQIEAGRCLPEGLARELAQAGFCRLFLPAAYGGLDLGPVEVLEVFEELARADASVAWCVCNFNVNWATHRLAPETAQEVFGDPESVLANSLNAKGRAEVVDGGYRVTGRWFLVSGCQVSDWFILNCKVHQDGQPRLTSSGTPESRLMFLPATECTIIDTWTAGGLRGTGSHDVVVEDRFVPARLSTSFTDPLVLPAPQYLKYDIPQVCGFGTIALGIARSTIDALIGFATEKRPLGTNQPLAEERGAQSRLAQAEALVSAARLYLYDTVNRYWEDLLTGRDTISERRDLEVFLASWHAVTSAVQAVDLIYLTGGATSLYTTYPIERAFRDVHAMTQHVAVNPRILERIGRVLFGLEPDK
jgi:alkylation response protein AidB-like acyl-CoA dehydrogenase